MRRSVGIHSKSTVPSPMIGVRDAMETARCVPNESCVKSCEDLRDFLNSEIPASAPKRLTPTFEAVANCEGSVPKILGRKACGANL